MKLSKDELISKVNEKIENVDTAIELIEDITDSFEAGEPVDTSALDAEIEDLKSQLGDLKERYKNRFLGIPEEPGEPEEPENVPELETKEVVDIKEI